MKTFLLNGKKFYITENNTVVVKSGYYFFEYDIAEERFSSTNAFDTNYISYSKKLLTYKV
ncbi:MAG: hypothetical protein RSF40_02100 [Oscillospiraceae bacterium]